MFNRYVWENYLKSDGKFIVEQFRNLVEGDLKENEKHYPSFVSELHKIYCPSDKIIEENKAELTALFENINDGEYACGCYGIIGLEDGFYDCENLLKRLCDSITSEIELNEKSIFDEFSSGIAYYTTLMAILFPEICVPYYFKYNFNVLKRISQEFEIELPPVPNKKEYRERTLYYSDLCESLIEFQESNNLSTYELWAFLYDFAPKYIGGIDSYIIKELPEPKSAFFIGASSGDRFDIKNSNEIALWQCNPDTRAGDMIVMYRRTPVSAVDSVWRSVSIGFNDPFFYYYRCTYISNKVNIDKVSQKTMRADKILSELPIVRKNMQGINGTELKPSEYNHLMDLANTNVPRLEFSVTDDNQNFLREKDVEDKLVKKLLEKLGYSEDDYEQQLYIEIGNHNHALIPDFVVLPVKTKGHHSAFFHVEAKLSIQTLKELDEVKIQARSYAKQLSVSFSVIASKEKIWITTPQDDYSEDVFSSSWSGLNNPDVFSELYKLIGKR